MNILTFNYKNHRGEFTERRVIPDAIEFLHIPDPKYYYQPSWFISGHDMDKDARRSFALSNIILDDKNNGVVGTATFYKLRLRETA